MFERFTDKARLVVVRAQGQAAQLQHSYVGPEHILLGLVATDNGLAVRVLRVLDTDPQAVADQVRELVGHGGSPLPDGTHIPFTPAAKKLLELSLQESRRLEHNYIGTEHLLLALLRQGEGPAYQVLAAHGIDLDTARAQVVRLLSEYKLAVSAGNGAHDTGTSDADAPDTGSG